VKAYKHSKLGMVELLSLVHYFTFLFNVIIPVYKDNTFVI